MADPALDDAATAWFLLRQSGDMTRRQRKAFDAWLTRDPAAPDAYRFAERAWRITGDIGEDARRGVRPIDDGSARWSAHRRRYAVGALAACAATALVLLADPVTRLLDVQLAPVRGGGQVLSTGTARRTATLADGSIVTLDTGTRLRVLEMGARRRIELLAGHAFFRVAKDPAHPFLVTAMDKTVHAVGTAFDVRLGRDAVAVTLVEGKVRVDQSRGLLRDPIATDLTPGKRLIAADDQVWMMTQVDPAAAVSWLSGRLTYTGETVGEIVADVNAGAARRIVFTGPVDTGQRIVGGFRPGDTDTLAMILETKGIARIVASDGERIEMQALDD